MSENKDDQAQSAEGGELQSTGGDDELSSAVKSLVEGAIDEAKAAAGVDSSAYSIEIEEEPVPVRKLPLQDTAGAAAGTVKNAAGAATATSKTMAAGAVSGGVAAAEAAVRLVGTAVNFIQDENVIELAAAFLDDAESEGRQFVDDLSAFLGEFLAR